MTMPTMTGSELIERLAQEELQIAIVCMSGYAETSILDQHTLPAVIEYLPKPFSTHDLLEKIARVTPKAFAAPPTTMAKATK